MILDKENELSAKQAITATAPSTDQIDLGVPGTPVKSAVALIRDIGPGNPIPLLIQVTEDFDNLTSLTIDVQTDSDVAFGSPTIVETQTILAADLLAGKQANIQFVPIHTEERYCRLNYTVNGSSPTQGQISAGVSAGNESNNNVY